MARVVLIEASPWDPATGAAVAVRLAGGGKRHYTHKNKADWLAGVVALPKVTTEIGFAQGGFTGGAIPQAASIGFAPSRRATRAALARLMWAGAPVVVSVGDDELEVPSWTVALAGTIAGYAVAGGEFTFTMSDMAGQLAKPLAPNTFAGTGGIEGPVEATGRVKRRSWGQVFNVEGRILDAANAIYEFGDPAFPLAEFVAVKDRGRAGTMATIAWAGSIAATLDALKAAVVAEGGAAVAPSIACVKWWTSQPAPAPLTADIRGEVGAGYVETVPAIAARIIAVVAGPPVASLASLNDQRPDAAGIHVDSVNETAAEVLDRLLLGASLTWSVDPAGFTRVTPVAFANPATRLRAHAVEREAAFAPVTRVEVGYRRNHRLHSDAEISAAVRSDTIVMPDGATVEAAIVGAGETAIWAQVAGDGRPADNADVTAANIASGFTGQGAFATLNSVGYGSSLLTGFGGLAALGSIYFGSPYLLEGSGGSQATLAAFKTAQGIASAITGQGAWATFIGLAPSAVANPAANLVYNGGFRLNAEGWSGNGFVWRQGVGEGAFVQCASSGTYVFQSDKFDMAANMVLTVQAETYAGGISSGGCYVRVACFNSSGAIVGYVQSPSAPNGQGWSPIAVTGSTPGGTVQVSVQLTLDNVANSNAAFRRVKVSQTANVSPFSDEKTTGALYPGGISIRELQPQEGGSNRTETRVASAFVGQGAFATMNSAAYGSPLLTGFAALATQSKVSLGGGYVFRADGTTAVTDALVVTSVGVASAVVGQSDWATYTSISTSTMAGRTSYLDSSGNLASLTRVTDRRVTMLVRADGATTITETAVITTLGVASAITGQGPWATTATSVDFVTGSYPNILYNGGLRLGTPGGEAEGWNSADQWVFRSDVNGNYYQFTSSTSGAYPVATTTTFLVQNGLQFTLQCEIDTGGLNAGTLYGQFTYFDQYMNPIAVSGRVFATSGVAGWKLMSGVITVNNASAVYARVDFQVETGSGTQNIRLRRMKVARGSTPSLFSDEATNGARIMDSRSLTVASVYGLRSLNAPPTFGSSVSGGSATVTVGADGVFYNDFGTSLPLPSASFPGLAFTTTYYFFRNMTVESTAGSYGYSTNLTGAVGANRAFVGKYTTPNSSGSGGAGGSYGDTECVAADAWVPTANRGVVRAHDIVAGDDLFVLTDDLQGITTTPCTGNRLSENEVCTLMAPAAQLTLAVNTPMTLPDHSWISAANAWGRPVARMDAPGDDRPIWEVLPDVLGVGRREVSEITCNNGTYAASDSPEGPFLFSHNLPIRKI